MDKFLTVGDQFRELLTDDEYLQEIWESENESGLLELIPGYNNITKSSLKKALKPNGIFTADILDAYIDLICKYHNTRDPAPTDHLPNYINFHASFWDRIINKSNSNRPNRGLSWGTEQLKLLAPNSSKAERRLQLFQVEYILIPIEREFDFSGQEANFDSWGHVAVMVISMPNKSIEYFDSLHLDPSQYFYHIFEYLTYELRELFELEAWSYRMNNNPMQIPAHDRNGQILGPLEQKYHEHGIDGGIHGAIHAFNVVFGIYDPIYQPQFDPVRDILKKRKRIIIDLLKQEITLGEPDDRVLQSRIHNHFLSQAFAAPDPSNPGPIRYIRHPHEDWVFKTRRPSRKHARDFFPLLRVQYSTWALHGRQPFPLPELDDLVGFKSSDILDLVKKDPNVAKGFLVKHIEGLDASINRYELRRDMWSVPILMRAIYIFYDEKRGGHLKIWQGVPE